jgi:hypothetical protein
LCGLMVLASNGGVRVGLAVSLFRATLVARIFTVNNAPWLAVGDLEDGIQPMYPHHCRLTRSGRPAPATEWLEMTVTDLAGREIIGKRPAYMLGG